jgi:hypothetical protein
MIVWQAVQSELDYLLESKQTPENLMALEVVVEDAVNQIVIDKTLCLVYINLNINWLQRSIYCKTIWCLTFFTLHFWSYYIIE